MSKVSFQSVVESVIAFLITGFLGVLYAYFVSGQSSNTALMRNFVETAFVFFPSVRTGMLMMHDGEGASTFLTLAFFTVIAMAVCGFLGISKKTFVFVLAILDVLYAFLLFYGDDGFIDEDNEDAHREARRENTHRAYRKNTYRASSDSAGKEESYSSGSGRYAGFEYEDEGASGENEYSYSHSESAESSYGSYYDDYSYYDGDGYNEYKRENYDYDFSEDLDDDDEDEETEQKESSQQSESSDKSSSDSYNSSSGSGYASSNQESDFDRALRVFGLKLPFSSADLKKRRNELVKKNHPDHGGTNEKMIEINKAYELLKRYAS